MLLGISTSVELFESRLPRSCVSLLQGQHFEVQEAGNCVDRIYEALQADPEGKIWVGRNITSTLFEKASDYFQTPEAFSRMVKVNNLLYFNTTVPNFLIVCVYVTFLCQSSGRASRKPRRISSVTKQILRGNQKLAVVPNVGSFFYKP